ncbi:hypothetical protein PAMA_012214 [Pampus argenteus]
MMLVSFFLLLLSVDLAFSMDNCSYQYLLKHLNMTSKNDLYSMSRPVKYHGDPTEVYLDMLIYAILDVKETEQTFISYIWIYMGWKNEHITWDTSEFCGLESIVVPGDHLWKPDIIIEEMTEEKKAPASPYLSIDSGGYIERRTNQVLSSTCKMQVYKFPFDIQTCNISFKSNIYPIEEMMLQHSLSSEKITLWSKRLIAQNEWVFVSITAKNITVDTFGYEQSKIVYTIKMKRRSILYIVNFLMPIMFLLCLDLATFLMSDTGGEKLGFQITLLLAVTVMQLLLNEILPSTSDRVPLIAVYCIGIFALMMLSLLETIVVMYLIEKDSQDNEAERDRSLNEKKLTRALICDASSDETPSEMLKGSSSQMTGVSHTSEKLPDDLREVVKTLAQLIDSRKDEVRPGYWTKMTKKINRVYFVFYITASSLFLVFIFGNWNNN